MSGLGKLQLSLTDLTFIGLGAIFGSGWLFAASHVSSIAGRRDSLLAVGRVRRAVAGHRLLRAGRRCRGRAASCAYPVFSHGPLLGYLMGFITLIAFSSLIAIEVVAARQYAAAWFPQPDAGRRQQSDGAGLAAAIRAAGPVLLAHYSSVKTFAKSNNLISIFKFIVPLLVMGVLFSFFKPDNFTMHGFAPFGMSGIEMAVSAGGIIFAYLGLTPIISVASEVRNPQRTIPIALILSVLLSTAIYVLLQVAFLGSIPADMLAGGWAAVSKQFSLPYRDIALILGGAGWPHGGGGCGDFPSGCGNIYMNATPRVVYGWARTGTFFKVFTRIDEKSGIPRPRSG